MIEGDTSRREEPLTPTEYICSDFVGKGNSWKEFKLGNYRTNYVFLSFNPGNRLRIDRSEYRQKQWNELTTNLIKWLQERWWRTGLANRSVELRERNGMGNKFSGWIFRIGWSWWWAERIPEDLEISGFWVRRDVPYWHKEPREQGTGMYWDVGLAFRTVEFEMLMENLGGVL